MEIPNHQTTPLPKMSQKDAMNPVEMRKLRKACADFEALLTQQRLASMRESSADTEGLFKKSYGEKLFQSMADQEIAEQMATGKGSGLGEMLFKQLSKNAGR